MDCDTIEREGTIDGLQLAYVNFSKSQFTFRKRTCSECITVIAMCGRKLLAASQSTFENTSQPLKTLHDVIEILISIGTYSTSSFQN